MLDYITSHNDKDNWNEDKEPPAVDVAQNLSSHSSLSTISSTFTDYLWFANAREASNLNKDDFSFLMLFLQRLHNLTDTSLNMLLKTFSILLPSSYNKQTTLNSVRNDVRNSLYYANIGPVKVYKC